MKKRFAAAAFLVAAALSLSACGGSGQTETTAAGGAADGERDCRKRTAKLPVISQRGTGGRGTV